MQGHGLLQIDLLGQLSNWLIQICLIASQFVFCIAGLEFYLVCAILSLAPPKHYVSYFLGLRLASRLSQILIHVFQISITSNAKFFNILIPCIAWFQYSHAYNNTTYITQHINPLSYDIGEGSNLHCCTTNLFIHIVLSVIF